MSGVVCSHFADARWLSLLIGALLASTLADQLSRLHDSHERLACARGREIL